jgi:glyoxylase-like metal-dependent hydrolase (beta-lactamase superfamily II)
MLEDGKPGHRIPSIGRFEVRTPTLPPATHTNVYIVGRGELAVVDPASPYPEERAALRDALAERSGERVVAIFLTHQHVDHVSGAAALKRTTGAPIWAHPETARRLVGRIAVDHTVEEGARVPAGGLDVATIHTPGHAPGHLCLFDTASRALICGDMVASIGTILVDADDDGDMSVYLASLARMRTLGASCLLPAHGPPIWNADTHLAGYIAHRQMREGRVKDALAIEPRTLDELVPLAYADVDPVVWPLAKRSLKAHLVKLVKEGAAVQTGEAWAGPLSRS